MTLLDQLGFDNTYAIGVPQALAEEYGLNCISDLIPIAGQLTFGAEQEFFTLEGSMKYGPFTEAYGLHFKEAKPVDMGLKYAAIENGSFDEAVNEGVRQAYGDGYLRKSVVADPVFDRVNTKDNTPAIIHTKIVSGNQIKITAGGKGFGSENMSAIKMLTPSYGVEGVKQFILDTVRSAGPNPCPPIVVGVGIGGTFERAAQLAKKATFRPIDTHNEDERYAALEDELLEKINKMGFGPAGLGGNTTALGVNIETSPTHIAGMPVAVNICCHAARHASTII